MEDVVRLSLNLNSFKYPDGTEALSDIRLEIKNSEFVGILGANGSGKTTLLKVMDGLLKDFSGNGWLDGANLKKLSPREIYKKVGLIFQNPDDQLFANTVFEDVSFGPLNMGFSEKEVTERVNNALNAVQMQGFEEKSIHHLSFGQKKRICIAGLLSMGQQILLLDEPTSGLDPIGVNAIMRLLKKINAEKGITMIMSTHSVDLVPLFIDRIIILDKGRIINEGLPKDVFAHPDSIRLAKLRLPRIGHLFEVLRKKDGFCFEELPLTIGQARSALKEILRK